MYYQNFTQYELNIEVTRIINVFEKDKDSGYTLLTVKEERNLIIRIQELERKLDTVIVIENIYNYNLGL
jgi:hypothetical protein